MVKHTQPIRRQIYWFKINQFRINAPTYFNALQESIEIKVGIDSQCKSSHRRYSIKKMFLKFSQISQENSCAGVSFLIRVSFFLTLLKKRLSCAGVFLWIMRNFKNISFTEHLRWVLLKMGAKSIMH